MNNAPDFETHDADVRFVPITREQYDVLANLFVAFAGTPVLPDSEAELIHGICDAWENAAALDVVLQGDELAQSPSRNFRRNWRRYGGKPRR